MQRIVMELCSGSLRDSKQNMNNISTNLEIVRREIVRIATEKFQEMVEISGGSEKYQKMVKSAEICVTL